METRQRIKSILEEMGRGAYEREEVIGLALLSALAGESIFLLGLPGVGKSMIARRLKSAFKNSRSFEYLMSRFSTPDEIFGPVSISKLKDNDSYERVTEGYLPTADIVFLDEIWKAGPAIQNSLLTVLNEKIFRNGTEDIVLPLKAVISASNELPAEGEGLEALWDRFLIRYLVTPIKDRDMFLTLVCGCPDECHIPDGLTLTHDELKLIQKESATISVPEQIADIIFSIRKTLAEQKDEIQKNVDVTKSDLIEPPYVSDRRWKKIMGVLKTSAYLNGRTHVDFSDCLLMDHMLWDKDEQIISVRHLVSQAIVNSIRHNGMDGIIGRVKDNSHSRPVGEPVSVDGIHYTFIVGDEEIRIKKTDYEALSKSESTFGVMTEDGRLVLSRQPSSLTVSKTDSGLSINSFSYSLKRNSSLRSGSVKDMTNGISNQINEMQNKLDDIISANIFIPHERMRHVHYAFSEVKQQIICNRR